jgi:2-polyprenyl-3-methyl-5-hydroxy-6-metoxy-1,4-benzoquinol methylase
MSVVASNSSLQLLAGISELAEYRQENTIATAFNVGNSFYATNEIWRERNPKTAAEIMQFYRDSVPGVAQQVFATYGIPAEIALRERIEKLVQPGERVLDFGAGIGSQLLPLLPKARHCTHVDVGGEQMKYAAWRYNQRGYYAGSYKPSGAVELVELADDYMVRGIAALAGRAFDTVICTEVLEHVTDPIGLVHLLATLVKLGGLLIATTSFDDGDGMVPMHLNVDRYTDEEFDQKIIPGLGFQKVESCVYRRNP